MAPPARKRSDFDTAWFQTWRSAAVQARAATAGRACRRGQEGGADRESHEASVLDRRVGENTFDVALAQGHEDAADGAECAEPHEHGAGYGRR